MSELAIRNNATPFLVAVASVLGGALLFWRKRTPSYDGPPRSVKRVAIIGAGIGGLTTAHGLLNKKDGEDAIQVTLFEADDGLSKEGAGFLLNGAIAVMGKISPKLQEAVLAAGWKTPGLRGRGANEVLFEVAMKDIVGSDPELQDLYVDKENGSIKIVMMKRAALQEVLYNELPEPSIVKFGKQLVNIVPSSEPTGGAMCDFQDGSQGGPFDVIVGADGVRSTVREYVEVGAIAKEPSQREGGTYTGMRIRYACQNPYKEANEAENWVKTLYGKNLFVFQAEQGTGKGKLPLRAAYLVRKDENLFRPFWKTPLVKPETHDEWKQVMLKELEEGGHGSAQEVRDIIQHGNTFFEMGVYYRSASKAWQREIALAKGAHAVLVGDASHCMPPFLGQGANQTAQDAYSLAVRIKEYNRQIKEAATQPMTSLGSVMAAYEKSRSAYVNKIVNGARGMGLVNTGTFTSALRDLVFHKVMAESMVAGGPMAALLHPKI